MRAETSTADGPPKIDAKSASSAAGGRPFLLVAYVLFIVNAGTNLPTPLYEKYREAWGFSPAILTVIYALYALTLIPALPYFGSLSDRFERARVLLAGVVAVFLASAIGFLAQNIAWLFAMRVVQGTALALVSGAASTALTDLEPRGDRVRSAMAATVALTAGGGVGVLAAGYLAEYSSHPLQAPFALHMAALVPAFLGLLAMPRLGRRLAPAAPERSGPEMSPRMRRGLVLACATSFLAFAVLALFLSLGPTLVRALLHERGVLVGAYVALDMLGSSALIQIFARRATLKVKLLVGLATLVFGLAAFVGATAAASGVAVFAATAVGGVGQGLTFLGAVELCERSAPPERHGTLVSTLYAASYAGGSFPVVAVGLGASILGLLPALTIYAVAAGACGLLLLVAVWSFATRRP